MWGIELLLAATPDTSVWMLEINAAPDGRVLLFTLLLSLASGVIAGIVPALHTVHPARLSGIEEQSQSVTRSRSRTRLQYSLVTAQIAVSVILPGTTSPFLR